MRLVDRYHKRGTGVIRRVLLLSLLFATGFFALLSASPVYAATTLPTKMNFQGRLASSGGTIMPNGTYNMRFKIYNALTGGSSQWSEDRLVSAGNGVTVTNGQFSVQLGSVTSLPASVFSSNSLYFEVELPSPATATSTSPSWTEGPMTPRNQLATSAYAYNAETLDGIDSDAFAQLGTGGTFTAPLAVSSSNATPFQVGNGSTNLFRIDNSNAQVAIGAADSIGTLLVLDTKNTSGDPSGTNGAIYYNSNSGKFRCYQAGAWTDCIPATGTAATLQSAYDNSSSPATITTSAVVAKGILFRSGTLGEMTELFQIENSSAVDLFTVDSINLRVSVGSYVSGGDGNGVIFVLDTKNTAGDPGGVNGAMYYNSTIGRLRCFTNNKWLDCRTSSRSSTAAQTISNTTAETNFNTAYSMDADECLPGRVYKINARGTFTKTTTTTSLTVKIKIGSTTVATTNTTSFGGSTAYTNQPWVLNADVICQTAGATGTVEAAGTFQWFTSAIASTTWGMTNTAPVTVNTTAAQTMQMSAQFSSTTASMVVRQVSMQVYDDNQ